MCEGGGGTHDWCHPALAWGGQGQGELRCTRGERGRAHLLQDLDAGLHRGQGGLDNVAGGLRQQRHQAVVAHLTLARLERWSVTLKVAGKMARQSLICAADVLTLTALMTVSMAESTGSVSTARAGAA